MSVCRLGATLRTGSRKRMVTAPEMYRQGASLLRLARGRNLWLQTEGL